MLLHTWRPWEEENEVNVFLFSRQKSWYFIVEVTAAADVTTAAGIELTGGGGGGGHLREGALTSS